ncbi:carbon-nitrogen hydrolase family protein [Nocardia paucivorans]|uniref:carbon-nitrogen hydrolase family protein n=1 Tax=Nocardia paucivorans TaxID=114259 RepID=UPI00031D40C0|nr:carbon-nitrogen hydrolase family protein [Nocardia paucivorans]
MEADTSTTAAPPEAARTDIAVVQFAPHIDRSANLAALAEQVRAAAAHGARVVVAPEYSMFAVARLDRRVLDAAEPLTGPFVTGLAELAAQTGVYLVAGVVETTEAGDGRIHNTLVTLAPDGTLVASYRKVHLYDAFGQRESDIVRPGPLAEPATFTADGVVFGLQTCFDLRFPEGFRRLAAAGAQVLLLPAQWIPGPGKVDQWTTLLRARAIENTVYVAAADQCAPRGAGASMIIDPTGMVLSELADEPGVAYAHIDTDRLARVRAVNPSFALRRYTIATE